MTNNFFDVDAEYRRAVEATGNLDSAFKLACGVGKLDWNGTDLTRAVLANEELLFRPKLHQESFGQALCRFRRRLLC